MRIPNRTVSPGEVQRHGQEHLARISSVPELAWMVERFQPEQDRFAAAAGDSETTMLAVRSARGRRRDAFAVLEGAVRSTLTTVRNRTRCSRKPGLLDLYFPDGLRPFLRTHASLVTNSRDLLTKLGNQADPELLAMVAPLAAAIEQAGAAVNALAASRVAARAARSVLLARRAPWELEYQRDFFDLVLLYKGIAGRAESFFWHPRKGTSPAGPSDPGGEEVPVFTGVSEDGDSAAGPGPVVAGRVAA